MFKPLKYQKGGTTASQEQLVQLFQAAAENAQVDPQQLVQKASEIGQDEEAAAQFMQGLQLCAQGDPEGIKFIKSLFQSPAFRKGGKIFEFICKHGRGGYVAGCGCKQEGGQIRPKLEAIRPEFKYLGEVSLQDRNNPNLFEIVSHGYNVGGRKVGVPTKSGAFRMGIDKDNPGAWDNGEQVYTQEQFDNIRRFYEESLPNSNRVQEEEDSTIGMQKGGMMQRSLPFTVNSLGMENENPAEFEKKAIMMRQRPMYAKCGSKVRK